MCMPAPVQRLHVCMPQFVRAAKVLLPCNCCNDMSSTKKNSRQGGVECNGHI